MDPNQRKDQDRSAANKPQEPNKQQREEKPVMPGPGERRDPNQGEDPASSPENSQPYDDKNKPYDDKNRPGGQKAGSKPDEQKPQNPDADTLKPGR